MKKKRFIKLLMGRGLPRNIAAMAAGVVAVKKAQYSDTLEKLLELRERNPYKIGQHYDGWRLAVAMACVNMLKDRPLDDLPRITFTISPGGGGNE